MLTYRNNKLLYEIIARAQIAITYIFVINKLANINFVSIVSFTTSDGLPFLDEIIYISIQGGYPDLIKLVPYRLFSCFLQGNNL